MLENLLLVAKVVTLKQNFHSYVYLEIYRHEKAARTKKNAEKELARKELKTSCCN